MRVLHAINCLSVGGAERQLLQLAAAQRRAGDEVRIVTLLDKDALGSEAEAAGVPVRALGVRTAPGVLLAIRRLRRWIDDFQPEVVQSWLYYANLAATLAARRRGGALRWPLAWNLRQTLPDLAGERFAMRRAIRLGARWSDRVGALVYNAASSRDQHRAIGYRNRIEEVIPNGFEVDRFRSGDEARRGARAALELPAEALVVAHAARWHPMKDHAGFLRAAAVLMESRRDLVVVMLGRDVTAARLAPEIASNAALRAAQESNRLRFPGERLDLQSLYPAFDLVVSSSAWGEAFPNVVAEAMASGVGVIATDVGESRALVAEASRVVPPSRPDLLAAAAARWLDLGPEARRAVVAADRARVADRFAVEGVLERYRALWRRMIAGA